MRSIQLFVALFFMISLLSCSKNNSDDPGQPLTSVTNVQYGAAPDSGGVSTPLLMGIYFPANAITTNKYPLVMMIHGGAFTSGDKSDFTNHCQVLADSGFVAVSINYRLGWRAGVGSCDGDTA